MSTDPPVTGPTKADLLTQIDADIEAAKATGSTTTVKVLTERRKVVSKPKTDAAARRAYDGHVTDRLAPPSEDPGDA